MPHPVPRAEYPRPQFARADWLNLNGNWQFETDRGDSGLDRGLVGRELAGEITVPFCPESSLSGIGDTDFLTAVWYRRDVALPAGWAGRRTLLHFQAVDQDATVWVNGIELGRHRGGFTGFTVDITDVATPGETATIVLRARDPHTGPQARGKQSTRYANHDCDYTRTTGIWQTVWLEPVPEVHLRRPRITPDLAGSAFELVLPLSANRVGHRVRATLTDADGTVAVADTAADLDLAPRLRLVVPEARRRVWRPGDPYLYQVRLELLDADGAVVDAADSYAGLRSVSIDGTAVRLNGTAVFQRLVLDQGYYADGILTAPDDAALQRDIELSMAAGFNGARLHQKVFEERFLYHADRLGYLVWGEFGDWGCNGYGPDGDNQRPDASYVAQWLEALERDHSHPAIVGWCPLNETWQRRTDQITVLDDVTRAMYLATKLADPSRPVVDASGYAHRIPAADVYDSHNYTQDPAQFGAEVVDGFPYTNPGGEAAGSWSLPYAGQPYFVSEFGGIWWNPDAGEDEYSWGYGTRPSTVEEFHRRFEGLVGALLADPRMFGYCYTQLTDVFQEQNGIYRFDRTVKTGVDIPRLRAAQQHPAAAETTS